MATRNAVNSILSGQNGSGSFVGSTSPTLVNPTLGVASSSSINFSTTDEIIGTTTNDDAATGSVGEILSSSIPFGSAISLTTNTVTELTHITLTPGAWETYCQVGFTGGATTVVRYVSGWTNTTIASSNGSVLAYYTYDATGTVAFPAGNIGINVASGAPIGVNTNTIIYLLVRSVFTVSTCSAYGRIYARRIR